MNCRTMNDMVKGGGGGGAENAVAPPKVQYLGQKPKVFALKCQNSIYIILCQKKIESVQQTQATFSSN